MLKKDKNTGSALYHEPLHHELTDCFTSTNTPAPGATSSTSVIAGISKLIKEVREVDHEDAKQMGIHLDTMLNLQERCFKLDKEKFKYIKRHGAGAPPN